METAISEISLVLFTTIAPAGIVGFMVMAAYAALARDRAAADRASRFLVVPLALVITGLIASATHLGTPANALYVLAGVGRSPLSNEVVAVVAFLVSGGVYWMASFRDDLGRGLQRAWLAVAGACGLVAIGFVAVAYSVPWVPTWNLPTAPLTLWLDAVSGGVLVGVVGLMAAEQPLSRRFAGAVLGVAAVAAVANVAVLLVERGSLEGIATTAASAVELVPWLPAAIVAYAACEAVALGVAAAVIRRGASDADVSRAQAPWGWGHGVAVALCGLVSLAGCFAVRFAFYAMHMTTGV